MAALARVGKGRWLEAVLLGALGPLQAQHLAQAAATSGAGEVCQVALVTGRQSHRPSPGVWATSASLFGAALALGVQVL